MVKRVSSLISQSSNTTKSEPSQNDHRLANSRYAAKGTDDLKLLLRTFLDNARKNSLELPQSERDNCEIEVRFGILKQPFFDRIPCDRRLLTGASKVIDKAVYEMDPAGDSTGVQPPFFMNGVTKQHFSKVSSLGTADFSPASSAFGVSDNNNDGVSADDAIHMQELTETVYSGYTSNDYYTPTSTPLQLSKDYRFVEVPGGRSKLEKKSKILSSDFALPFGDYDLRLTLATEMVEPYLTSSSSPNPDPPQGYNSIRIKRRRRFTRKDNTFAWQIDVTDVISEGNSGSEQTFEIEIELTPDATRTLLTIPKDDLSTLLKTYAIQLEYMIQSLAPFENDVDVATYLERHPNFTSVNAARMQCARLREWNSGELSTFQGAIGLSAPPITKSVSTKFIGSMPVNFQRHNIPTVQTGDYYVSEKTDGVRYLMVFTGNGTVVLLDRKMEGWRPACEEGSDPFERLGRVVKAGTVFDGEVVINRSCKRAVFIIFDILCCGEDRAMVRHAFKERLRYLNSEEFIVKGSNGKPECDVSSIIDGDITSDKSICPSLPLIRKKFRMPRDVDKLMSLVVTEKARRTYIYGANHNHLTDGIIFQPNKPYVMDTDYGLTKWKYLDTATIDVEVSRKEPDFKLCCHVEGGEGRVDMTRYVNLPVQELMRLEADRNVTGCKIAEVGFDPETGAWYYKCMRPDKKTANHIGTVMGTLLELAENIGDGELRVRMLSGAGDTYVVDKRRLEKGLLEEGQRRK